MYSLCSSTAIRWRFKDFKSVNRAKTRERRASVGNESRVVEYRLRAQAPYAGLVTVVT